MMAIKRLTWLIVSLVAAGGDYLLRRDWTRPGAAVEAAIANGPLTVSANYGGGRPGWNRWELQLDAAGSATVTTHSRTSSKTHRFLVSHAQLDELRKALWRESFFDLGDWYGVDADDVPATTLLVSAGRFNKIVTLQEFPDWNRQEPQRLLEANRALRVLQMIRKYDQAVIDAAK
jgi:hypothetical protein